MHVWSNWCRWGTTWSRWSGSKKLDDVLVLGFMNGDQNVYNEIKIRDLTNFVKDVMKKNLIRKYIITILKMYFSWMKIIRWKNFQQEWRLNIFEFRTRKNPDLLVLDEPTSGLDPIVRDEVLDILRCVAKEKYFRVILVPYYRRYRKNSR